MRIGDGKTATALFYSDFCLLPSVFSKEVAMTMGGHSINKIFFCVLWASVLKKPGL
jgi:hypothetical protein